MAQALILALVTGTGTAAAWWWEALMEALVCSILLVPSFHLIQFLGGSHRLFSCSTYSGLTFFQWTE